MSERRRVMCGLGLAGLCAATIVGLLHAHDHPSHGADALPPYEGDGYTAGAGGYPGMQFPSQNVHLLSWLPIPEFGEEHESANDCWGYISPSGREYAMLGLSHGTGFVEISNPGDPQILATIPGIPSTWRDMKVYDQYAYVVSEGSGGQGGGIQVIDLTQIDDGIVTHINSVTEGGSLSTTRTHNVALDEESGYLYRCGGGGGTIGIRIYSLADPANPAFVGEWHERYVHDAQVVTYTEGPYAGMQVAFLYTNNQSNGGDPGLDILDVTDKSNIVQLGFTSYSFPAFSHQGWLNDERTLVYLNDELAELEYDLTTTTRVIDVSDLSDPFEVSTYTNGQNSIGHNIYIRDTLVLAANYRSGLRVFDTATDPLNPREVGYFDTFPEDDGLNFNGLWSNFPYYPSGVVIGSDIEKGLFVWWIGDMPLAFEYPEGKPEVLNPSGQSVRLRIATQDGQQVEPGSAQLHYDAGEGEIIIELIHVRDDLYDAVFPALPCNQDVSWYVSATNLSGLIQRDPPEAPEVTHEAVVWSEACENSCPADLAPKDGDGVVNVADMLVLLVNWGDCPRAADCPADLTGDGTVDVADLLALLQAWGPCN